MPITSKLLNLYRSHGRLVRRRPVCVVRRWCSRASWTAARWSQRGGDPTTGGDPSIGATIDHLIERVKQKKERLFGFGHSVYTSYDPHTTFSGDM